MRQITITYRKLIDNRSEGAWEKLVFADSYREFCMQGQLYSNGGTLPAFSQMKTASDRAVQLHHLVSTAVIGYLRQLGGVIPDLHNSLGQSFLSFDQYRFEIVASHLKQQEQHQVAITFFSHPLLWHDTIGEQLLLSGTKQAEGGAGYETHLFKLPPFTGIHSLQIMDV